MLAAVVQCCDGERLRRRLMTKYFAVFTLMMFIGVVFVKQAFTQSVSRNIPLLDDTEHHQWCAYRSESDWTAEVRSLNALSVGTLEYTGDHISKIDVTAEDESGDWIVYDHYALDSGGKIRELSRTINILPGDRSENETYIIRDEKARKQSSSTERLSTKEVLPSQQDQETWLPNVPVVTRLKDFPFSDLISKKSLDTSSSKVCIPEKKHIYARHGYFHIDVGGKVLHILIV